MGPFDVVASSYGIRCQGADEIVLTKLDILSVYDEIEVCTAYELDGKDHPCLPLPRRAQPLQTRLREGQGLAQPDISKCRKKEELPKEALDYIKYIEEKCSCNITYVAVGAERDAVIKLK